MNQHKWWLLSLFLLFNPYLLLAYSEGVNTEAGRFRFQFEDLHKQRLLSLQMPHLSIAPIAFSSLLSVLQTNSLVEPSIDSLESGVRLIARGGGHSDFIPAFLYSNEWKGENPNEFLYNRKLAFQFGGQSREGMERLFALMSWQMAFYHSAKYYQKGEAECRWRTSAFFSYANGRSEEHFKKIAKHYIDEGAYLERGNFTLGRLAHIGFENSLFWKGGREMSFFLLSMDEFNPIGGSFIGLIQQQIKFFSFFVGIKGVTQNFSAKVGQRLNPGVDWMAQIEFEFLPQSYLELAYSRRDYLLERELGFVYPLEEKFRFEIEYMGEKMVFRNLLRARSEVNREGENEWSLRNLTFIEGALFRGRQGQVDGNLRGGFRFSKEHRGGWFLGSGLQIKEERIKLAVEMEIEAEFAEKWEIEPQLKVEFEFKTSLGLLHIGISYEAFQRSLSKGDIHNLAWLELKE